MRHLGILFLLGVSVGLAADGTAPSSSTTPISSPPVSGASVQKAGPAATKSALPPGSVKPAAGPAHVAPDQPGAAKKDAAGPKPAPPGAPVPARFLQVRGEMAEIYPDAGKLPVIWDEAHDPFRFGYSAEDEADGQAGAVAKDDAGGDGKPAAPPKQDLDTASLLEAGLDMIGGKGPKKPSGGGDSSASSRSFTPLNDAELLKRGVGKLRVGGVVTVRGVPRIMIDSVPRKIGDVITVSVSGKQAKIQLVKLGDNTVEFILQGTTGKPPSIEITF